MQLIEKTTTHRTELCSSPGHVVPKPPSRSEGGCLPSSLRPVGLHSCCCHRLPKHGLKAEPQASSHWVSVETTWLKQLDSVAVETPRLLSPPQFKLDTPLLPPLCSPCLLLIIRCSLLGGHRGEGDVGPFILFVISSEWWPKTREFTCFQLAKTSTENVCEEAKRNFV